MAYPVTMEPLAEPRLPRFYLGANPFAAIEAVDRGKFDPLTSFWMCVAAKEAARVWWLVAEQACSDHPSPLWLLRDPNSVGSSNITTIADLLRRFATDEDAQLLSIYLPLPLAYEDMIKGILRTIADRIVPTDFRKCFYAFAADRVEEVVGTPAAQEELSAFEDVGKLAAELRNPKASGIQSFLLPSRKRQVKERHIVNRPAREDEEEEEGEEETAEAQAERLAEREEILATWERRNQLRAFLERRLREGDWGDGVQAAMRKVFETSAFMQAHDSLTDTTDHRGTLAGLLRFLRYRFSKAIILVDQVEAFAALTEIEKASFYGALAEFEGIAQSNAMWLFTSFPTTVELIGEKRLAIFDMIPFDLKISREIQQPPVPAEVFAHLVQQFLESDPHRSAAAEEMKKKGLESVFPFDSEALAAVLEAEDGDCMRSVVRLGQLLDRAHADGVERIDASFVAERAAEWAREQAAEEEAAAAQEQAAAEEKAVAEERAVTDEQEGTKPAVTGSGENAT